jgi:hypothetical protein
MTEFILFNFFYAFALLAAGAGVVMLARSGRI